MRASYQWFGWLRLLSIAAATVALLPTAATPQPVAAQAGVAPFSLQWTAASATVTRSVAWGDIDGDGDLDLAVGNDGQPNQLYRNQEGTLTLDGSAWAVAPKSGSTHSLAWGDVDNDGDLDLAVGNDRQASQLYRNTNGILTRDASAWTIAPVSSTQSLAWTDVDGDGWLDLVAGRSSGPNLLYRNHGGVLTLDTNWMPAPALTYSVAWGDVDNDGDLDLAVGNYGLANQIYRNDGGVLTLEPTVWAKAPTPVLTHSIAWGDIDGDGWLDLVAGNAWQSDISNLPGAVRLPSQLYHNDHGTLTLTDWKPNSGIGSNEEEPFDTQHVEFADIDSDGDLDLLLSDYWQPIRLYQNKDGTLDSQRDTSWTPGAAPTYTTALGDVDNDGDLDLVVGNHTDQPLQLYRNDTGTLSSTSDPDNKLATGSVKDASMAWGDVDNDGDLDLLIGQWSDPDVPDKPHPNELWLNTNGVLTRDTNWNPEVRTTRSVAWGDVDGDGDLDLAVGNEGQSNQLFLNAGGVLTLDTTWQPAAVPTRSLAWGDVDNDGDLDLLVSNHGGVDQLYRNLGTTLSTTPEIGWARAAQTNSVAWGDVDNDGDLDLIAGNANQPSQLYRNTGGTLSLDPTWTPPASDTQSMAWGDVDNDGDLDLAVGNRTGPNQLYRNDGGRLSSTPETAWARAASETYSVAWGDADGDGWLDLAVGNYGQSSQIYHNDHGNLTLDLAWNSGLARTTSVAWGDMDNDGDLDLVLGNVRGSDIYSRFHWVMRNGSPHTDRPQNKPPSIAITRPATANADFFSSPQIYASQTISIPYTLFDQENDPVRAISVTYSLNGGGDWRPAVAASGTPTTDLAASRDGVNHTFVWDVFASGFFGQSDDVVVRIAAMPSVQSQPSSTAGPFQHAMATATTFPFRVRGTQVRVLHADGSPAPNALVYRLPKGQSRGGQLFPARSTGQPALLTDGGGYLPGHDALAYGDLLAALEPISTTASYTLYATNVTPNDDGLTLQPVTAGGEQLLSVTGDKPLVLLNLQVSLEWDARHDEQFMRQLQSDLKRTSELLFDWSDGQIALGHITVYQNREHWNDAHVRIYATNRMRPNATKGGITEAERSDPDVAGQQYTPGQVRIGAVWNRYGEASANLGEDWPRTLAHELGHFALYLDDNYLGTDDNGALTSVATCPGAMSDPYRDDYTEFHPDAGWLQDCAQTLSQRDVGRSDWATIKTFYEQANLGFHLHEPATFNAQPGPASLPLALTTVELAEQSDTTRTFDAPIFFLTHAGSRVIPGPGARAFLLGADRLTDLGSPTLDQVLARGARTDAGDTPADRLCVFDPSNRRLGCRSVSTGDQQLELTDQPEWMPDLTLTPVTSTTLRLDVRGVGANRQLSARLYPIAGVAPSPQRLASNDDGGSVTFTLPPDAPSFEGYVSVWEGAPDDTNPQRATVSDYLIGGNPGRRWSRNAPRGNPGRRWSRNAPVLSSDGQAILYGGEDTPFAEGQFFALQAVTTSPRPLSWATPVGRAYRLTATDGTQFSNTTLSISYLGDEVQSEDEDGIQMYAWNEKEARWQPLTTRRDTIHNEASAKIAGPGLYMLMTSVAIPLTGPGWNLVAYPVRATRPVTEALAAIDGSYSTVYGYDASAAERWQIYDPSAPTWVNTLRDLQFGHGYWINATDAITLYLRSDTSATLSITSGQRTQSLSAQAAASTPVPPATFYGTVEGMVDEEVVAWIGNVACGRSHTHMIGGKIVYSVHVDADSETKGCGTADRVVRFTVGGRKLGTSTDWINDRAHLLPLQVAGAFEVYLPVVVQAQRH